MCVGANKRHAAIHSCAAMLCSRLVACPAATRCTIKDVLDDDLHVHAKQPFHYSLCGEIEGEGELCLRLCTPSGLIATTRRGAPM